MKRKLLVLVVACFAAVSFASAQNPDIRGTWKMVTIDGKKVPEGFSVLKLITDTHFTWTLADADGNIIEGAAGRYAFSEDRYTESFDYVLPALKKVKGLKLIAELIVEGDRMTVNGTLEGKPWLQTWERVE